MLQLFSLQGRTAVVTGGYGRYGKQIVLALAQAGAKVYTSTRSESECAAIQAAFRKQGADVRVYALDQEQERSIAQFGERVFEDAGRVDILVNNAVSFPVRDWHDPAEAFERSMRVNATGLFLVTRTFGDPMAAQGAGSIINIASIQGMVGPDGSLYEGLETHGFLPDYFFHKGGLLNFTRFVAGYYGPRGVRCNALSPGGYRTDNHAPEFVQRYASRTMLGRMAGDTDMMGAVVFLASDASAYVTGANLPVDGGYTAK